MIYNVVYNVVVVSIQLQRMYDHIQILKPIYVHLEMKEQIILTSSPFWMNFCFC